MKPLRLAAFLLLAFTAASRAETVYWSDNFETNSSSHWSATSPWHIGFPTKGPGAPNSGNNCAMTESYTANKDVRLICTSYLGSNTIVVPSSDQYPRLRFWQWMNFANALGYVEISTDKGSTWTTISQSLLNINGSGVWSRQSLDLRPYAGLGIQVAFHFTSGGVGGNGLGWYVDDVALVTGSPVINEPEGFESGQGDWGVSSGTWEVGYPGAGPGYANSGNNCAGTVLNGNYANNANSTLFTPPFVVASWGNQALSFWHWYNLNNALAYVNISTDNGNTWTQLASYGPTASSGAWVNTSFDLSSYAGQAVIVGFNFVSGGVYSAPGWYIDDIKLPYTPSIVAITASGDLASPNNAYQAAFTVSRSGGVAQAITVNLAASGTAVAGSDYVPLPTMVTMAANQTSTNLYVLVTNANLSSAKTVVLSPVNNGGYDLGLTTSATVTLIPNSSTTNNVTSPVGRYWRGSGGDPTFWSMVVPTEYETGTVYSNLNGNCTNLYPGLTSWSSQTLYHYDGTNTLPQTSPANRIPFNNPIVAFGEHEGGTPLYFNQPYSFGIYAGDPYASNQAVVVQAYYRTNYQLAGTVSIYPPTSGTGAWANYHTNGYQITTNAYGLTTMLSGVPNLSWGEFDVGFHISFYNGAYALTHTASPQATNYYYVVSLGGNPGPKTTPMVMTSSGQIAASLLYSLDFEARPPWRSVFLDQPQFNGSPMPPFYAGMTVNEMLTNTPAVTNVVTVAMSTTTNLDNSPELRRHPILDNFVASQGNDPIALANYVINQIDLTDPMDYNDNGSTTEDSINPGGVTRGALGTFLEKQGSPIEQCALLVYLLRQAGVPAVYEFAPHNGLQMLDARLSQMLKFQVHGDANYDGAVYTTNTMIPVNYPWVAAYIGTNWVHIFPWLKDYRMVEGVNLFDEMPTNYANAYLWMRDYIYGATNLLSLAVDGDNTPRVIFPRFLQQTLLQNHPGISVDDIGMKIINRQHYYARWQDFPTPTWLTNVSTTITNLSSTALTNVNPALTNIFDTMSVEIYSLNDPTKDIFTGDMRLCDLHNREFYINQFMTNSAVQLNLVLMPYRTNNTIKKAFSNDPALTNKEVLSLTFDANDYQLGVRFRYHRHRAITPATAIDPFTTFLGFIGDNEMDFERPLFVGDQAAICLDYGRVTSDMLNVHAASLWQMQSLLNASPSSTNSVSADVYEGEMMYLAGMSYYQKSGDFERLNQQLQKFNTLSLFAAGLSKILPARNSAGSLTNGTDPVLPAVDMLFYQTVAIGNSTMRPDSGQTLGQAQWNYNLLSIINLSAEEHQTLNRFYQQTNAVSTVRLLQLAQSTTANGIVELDGLNYGTKGGTSYQGKTLQSWDPDMWTQTASALSLGYATAYMTPGPVTNRAYKGMGVLILNPPTYMALITPSTMNGGFAGQQFPPNTVSAANSPYYNYSDNNGDPTIALNQPASGATTVPDEITSYDIATTANDVSSGRDVSTAFTASLADDVSSELGTTAGTSGSAVGQDLLVSEQNGYDGRPDDAGSQRGALVSDPVHNVTGEFYVNETDLQLPGPIPLALNRNYSSQNLADNQFGRGWKLNIMPYLTLSKGSTNIYAADMDGAVLAYVHSTNSATTNLWTPTLAANPSLVNNTTAGAGGLVNRLRDSIVRSFNGSITNYTLYGADGSVRVFQFMKFNSGAITNARPYLTKWTDNRGNYYTFAYDTNSADANFGQMQRIQCSNGNYLGFDYDVYGHIIDAYTGDGRWTYYDYDEYGDLVTVTLADESTRSYQYQHATQAVTGGTATYSTHLIVEEDKPDGRELINAYDSQRRVTNQLSTAGSDLNPVRTATFIYANNFVFTNSYTNPITGYTLTIDGNNHTNRYDYQNNLITTNTDPLGQVVQQIWYPDNTNAPGYPRSLMLLVDKRHMTNFFQYDGNGNVTNRITFGDLTGDGNATQSCTNTTVYNTNSLPMQSTDPAGNSTLIVYDPVFTFLPQQTIRYAGLMPVATNYTIYGNTTNVVTNGSLTQTNLAFGLPIRQIRAYGSPDAATNDTAYDGHGFMTQSIRYPGTGDPNVINTFFYNERGQMVTRADALGALTFFDYDALDRPIDEENFDELGNALAWSFNYYNDNGELTWIDGPRYNPEDYVFYDYDGAGRRTTEIHWRSEANSAGTGVESPAGYNLYAQSFYQYDVLGNLTLAVDPRGAMTTNKWDALCRLVQRQHLDTDGITVLSTESFGYEPGGQVQFYTNALGGVTTTLYTEMGKPEFRSNPDGSTNAWRYYLDGRISKEIQGNGAYWTNIYNDASLITTRIFVSAVGIPLATNSTQLDRRGNVIRQVDAGGNVFVSVFDGLDRSKIIAGPSITNVTSYQLGNPPSGPIYYNTNSLQQAVTNFYDAAGRVMTNVNALGEFTVTTMDALGRTTSTQIRNSSAAMVREEYVTYSADHNSVTVRDGSGANAISHTTWTDTDGHTVLSIAYPSANATEFVLNQYDLAGNLIAAQHDSSGTGGITTWTTTSLAYDGLNRLIQKFDRDNAQTTYAYNSMGNLISRVMPGRNLAWSAVYSTAGQMLTNWNSSGSSGTRTNTYTYFTSSSPYVGLPQATTDGRGVTCMYSYDDWLRPTNLVFNGSLQEQDATTSLQYEPRGYLTSISEQFANTNLGPATTIQRSYDPYGQLVSESVNGGAFAYGTSQSWDAAGRRTQLNIGGANNYGFNWQADGGLTAVSDSTGGGNYTYDTVGNLTSRIVGNRQTSIASRDGEGRPLAINTTINAVMSELNETNVWSGDGLLLSHTLWRADYGLGLDNRAYSYATASRRLTQEQLNLNNTTAWTNSFVYDNGTPQGPGVLTSSGNGPASWNGGTDAFGRISTATNSLIPYAAFGHVNGQSTLSAWLDNQAVSVTGEGTNAMQWRASMELAQGPHQLLVAAAHPSGLFTAWATNTFTNSLANQVVSDTFDSAGNITSRVWRNPSGAIERTQTLSWDARGRLHAVTELDANTNGYNWTAVYDGLNRRLSTTSVLLTNGVVYAAPPTTINSYFDPEVEFLELGVSYGKSTEWKLYGPDLNGVYGGANGTGGFEAVSPYLNLFEPVISDFRGNVLGVVTNSAVAWNPARPTGYGAVPNYRPVALGSGANISLSSAWRGHWADVTGYHCVGTRTYDPISGRWLSFDPSWNEADPNGFSAFGGDPINSFDADGRISRLEYEIQDLPQEVDALWDKTTDGGIYDANAFFSLSSEGKNVLGSFFPGQSYNDLDESQKLFALSLMSGHQPDPSFTDAGANASYYNQMSANGLNQGGVSGYAQYAAGQIGEDLLDLFGETSVQQSAEQSGYASADPNRQGAAWAWGTVTVGTIALNAVPGGGKATSLVEQEGLKVLTAKTAEQGLFRVGEAGGIASLPRTMETVLQHAEQAGVGLEGINVKIIPEAPANFYGWAAPSGAEIHLYPSAFMDSETLVRTLAHERTHAYQFKTFGSVVNESTESAARFEEGAYGAEESFWQYFLGNGGAQ
jgi:RHS repeat-associated protein